MKVENEIDALTGLRFVAAFVVFVFHIQIRWPLIGQPFIANIINQGAVGMSIFFMLSGFLLAYRYADGKTSYRDYALNRFARIYPIYALAAIVTLPWIGVTSVGKGIVLVLADIFLVQAWNPKFFPLWNNGGSWSISVEAFCYALLPFILVRLVPLSNKQLLKVMLVAYAAVALPTLFASFVTTPFNHALYSVPLFRLPEFTLGVCASLFAMRGFGKANYLWLQLAVCAVVLVYLGLVGSGMYLYVGHSWLMIPAIGCMIFTLANGKGFLARILATRLFVWLGKISYCFYSFQVLLIILLVSHHDALVAAVPPLANNRLLALGSFTLLIAVAMAAYYLVEAPLRMYIRRRRAPMSAQPAMA